MEFGLKATSRLVADVTGSRHSGLGFTVFWLFMAEYLTRLCKLCTRSSVPDISSFLLLERYVPNVAKRNI